LYTTATGPRKLLINREDYFYKDQAKEMCFDSFLCIFI